MRNGAFSFLRWVDEFLPLAFTGLFTNIGLFTHLVIMWFSPIHVHVQGLFYGAPYHDVPADDRIFDNSHYNSEFCCVGGSEFLSEIPKLL